MVWVWVWVRWNGLLRGSVGPHRAERGRDRAVHTAFGNVTPRKLLDRLRYRQLRYMIVATLSEGLSAARECATIPLALQVQPHSTARTAVTNARVRRTFQSKGIGIGLLRAVE